MSFNTKIRLFQLFIQIMGVFSLGYIFYTGEFYWLWFVFIGYIILGPINIGLTFHRLLTHRTFKTYKWLENILSFLTIYSALGPTVTWVGLHRFHHANSDTDLDPHSPKHGMFQAWTGLGWNIPQIPLKYVKDVMRDPVHKFILNNYFKLLIAGIVLLTLIDPVAVLFVYFLPCALAFHGVNAINVIGHRYGYRNFNTDDCSTNNLVVHFLTWDCLHNNHHHTPGSWNNKVKRFEFDPLGSIIGIIRIK